MSSGTALPPKQPPASPAAPRTPRNRQNPKKSTAPRTAAGKQRSAQNARTHGLTSTLPPNALPVPDPTPHLRFDHLKQRLTQENPPTPPPPKILLYRHPLNVLKLPDTPTDLHPPLSHPDSRS